MATSILKRGNTTYIIKNPSYVKGKSGKPPIDEFGNVKRSSGKNSNLQPGEKQVVVSGFPNLDQEAAKQLKEKTLQEGRQELIKKNNVVYARASGGFQARMQEGERLNKLFEGKQVKDLEFSQKDGVLNIREREVPLSKSERLQNFYSKVGDDTGRFTVSGKTLNYLEGKAVFGPGKNDVYSYSPVQDYSNDLVKPNLTDYAAWAVASRIDNSVTLRDVTFVNERLYGEATGIGKYVNKGIEKGGEVVPLFKYQFQIGGGILKDSVRNPLKDVVTLGAGKLVGAAWGFGSKAVSPIASSISSTRVGAIGLKTTKIVGGIGLGGVVLGGVALDVATSKRPVERVGVIGKEFALFGAGFNSGVRGGEKSFPVVRNFLEDVGRPVKPIVATEADIAYGYSGLGKRGAVFRGGKRVSPKSKTQIKKEAREQYYNPNQFFDSKTNDFGLRERSPELKKMGFKEKVTRFSVDNPIVDIKGMRFEIYPRKTEMKFVKFREVKPLKINAKFEGLWGQIDNPGIIKNDVTRFLKRQPKLDIKSPFRDAQGGSQVNKPARDIAKRGNNFDFIVDKGKTQMFLITKGESKSVIKFSKSPIKREPIDSKNAELVLRYAQQQENVGVLKPEKLDLNLLKRTPKQEPSVVKGFRPGMREKLLNKIKSKQSKQDVVKSKESFVGGDVISYNQGGSLMSKGDYKIGANRFTDMFKKKKLSLGFDDGVSESAFAKGKYQEYLSATSRTGFQNMRNEKVIDVVNKGDVFGLRQSVNLNTGVVAKYGLGSVFDSKYDSNVLNKYESKLALEERQVLVQSQSLGLGLNTGQVQSQSLGLGLSQGQVLGQELVQDSAVKSALVNDVASKSSGKGGGGERNVVKDLPSKPLKPFEPLKPKPPRPRKVKEPKPPRETLPKPPRLPNFKISGFGGGLFTFSTKKQGKNVVVGYGVPLERGSRELKRVIQNSARASGKISGFGGGLVGNRDLMRFKSILGRDFVVSKQNPYTLVERPERRIKSRGELMDITFKGIRTSKNKKKNRKGFFGGFL